MVLISCPLCVLAVSINMSHNRYCQYSHTLSSLIGRQPHAVRLNTVKGVVFYSLDVFA